MAYTLKDLFQELELDIKDGYIYMLVHYVGKRKHKLLIEVKKRNKVSVIKNDTKKLAITTVSELLQKYGDITDVVIYCDQISPEMENKISVPLSRVLHHFAHYPDRAREIRDYNVALRRNIDAMRTIKRVTPVYELFKAFAYITKPDLDWNAPFGNVYSLYTKENIEKAAGNDEEKRAKYMSQGRLLKLYSSLYYLYIYARTKDYVKGPLPHVGAGFLLGIVYYEFFFGKSLETIKSAPEIEAIFRSVMEDEANMNNFNNVFKDFPGLLHDDMSVNVPVLKMYMQREWTFLKGKIESALGRKLGNNNSKEGIVKMLLSVINEAKEVEMETSVFIISSQAAHNVAQYRIEYLESLVKN